MVANRTGTLSHTVLVNGSFLYNYPVAENMLSGVPIGAASVAVHVTVTFINVNYDSFFFALVTYLVALVVILMR